MATLRVLCEFPAITCVFKSAGSCRIPSSECIHRTLGDNSVQLMLSSVQHDLKIWPQYFEEVLIGNKKFELRSNDRGYKVGDILMLREWIPEDEKYTGRWCRAVVTYILDDFLGSDNDLCIMSTEVFDANARSN